MAQESGPGRLNSLFEPTPEDEQTPLLNLTNRIEAARSQARPTPPEGRSSLPPAPPPPGAARSDPAAADGARARKLVFSPTEADQKPQMVPIEELFPGEGPPRPGAFGRLALVTGAIVAFVFLNAALLGYLPFIERRPTAPLRVLKQGAPVAPTLPMQTSGPPLATAAPTSLEPEVEPTNTPAPARLAPPPEAAPSTPPARAPTPRLIAAAPAPPSPATGVPVSNGVLAPRAVAPPSARPRPVAALPVPKPPATTAALSAAPPSKPASVAPLAAATTGGAYAVQVGAFKTDALAAEALGRATAAGPAGAAALVHKREPVEKDGGTLYRALLSGFSTSKEAAQFCATLKTAGMACFVKH